jgi:hypothetical protein
MNPKNKIERILSRLVPKEKTAPIVLKPRGQLFLKPLE